MSKIDQAFIHAYTPDNPASAALPQRQAGPHPWLDSSTASPREPATANVLRSPHFSPTPTQDARSAIAALQQGAVQFDVSGRQAAPRVDAPPTERRPLSSFSASDPATEKSFRPVFEVDAFRWPQITTDLLQQHSRLLIPVAEQLLEVSEAGRSLIGVAGTRENVGASTVLLCLARLLASTEKTLALVDADFSKHSLANDLGLEIESGWEDVLTGKVPLAEGVVHSLHDNVSLLPLAGSKLSGLEVISSIQTSVSAGVLRYHYDIVLFDLGSSARMPQWKVAQRITELCRIDTSIIVADAQHTDPTANEDVDHLLAILGKGCLGLIGNDAVS